MKVSELAKNLQDRLSLLLEDPLFAKARQDRVAQKKNWLEDANISHNFMISEEILHMDASLAKGVVSNQKIDDFKNHIISYLERNSTGNKGYDCYIAIVSEYLVLVVQQPLHPLAVRHLENNPPEDSENGKYCGWRLRYIKDHHSLCRYCNCLPWPREIK